MKKIKYFDEPNLVDRIKANDRGVLGEIFIRYEKMVFSYIKTHGGNDADAEDVLQESIITLWQNVCSDAFTLSSKLGTYIMGVAKNKWREELRKRRRISGVNEERDFPDMDATALESILTQEEIDLVHQALNTISLQCKELLMLFYFEERSLSEIVKILNFANTDVVKSKKYQCKKALESEMRRIRIKKL